MHKYKEATQLVVAGHLHKWVGFADTSGPQYYAIAATGYDPNAYTLTEVDCDRNTWRFLNESLVEWSTHDSKPYTHA